MPKPSELLKGGHWTQGYFAYTADGEKCASISPDAVKWCVMGAFGKCAVSSADRLRFAESLNLPDLVIANWNDAPGRTEAEVVAALEAAGL